MKTNQKPINALSFQELAGDFLNSATNIEKRFFLTFWSLLIRPEIILEAYVGGEQRRYTSVFRYFLASLFFGFIIFSLLFSPDKVGGAYYHFLLDSLQQSVDMKSDSLYMEQLVIDPEKFNVFFLEFTHWLTYFYKLMACFSIPSIFFGFLILGRKSKFNGLSLFVMSLFVASQISFIGSFTHILTNFMGLDFLFRALAVGAITFLYQWFVCYRIFSSLFKRPKMTTFLNCVFAGLIFISLQSAYGVSLWTHVASKTPSFQNKLYTDPALVEP